MTRTIRIFLGLLGLVLLSAFVPNGKRITLFLIGDSTMADRTTGGGNLERGWSQMLDRYFTGQVRVENHAARSRSSKSFLDEGRWQRVLGAGTPALVRAHGTCGSAVRYAWRGCTVRRGCSSPIRSFRTRISGSEDKTRTD